MKYRCLMLVAEGSLKGSSLLVFLLIFFLANLFLEYAPGGDDVTETEEITQQTSKEVGLKGV